MKKLLLLLFIPIVCFGQESITKNGVVITAPNEFKKTSINSTELQQQFMTDDQKQQLLVSVLPPMPLEEITEERVVAVLLQDNFMEYEVFKPVKNITSIKDVYYSKAIFKSKTSPPIYAFRLGFKIDNKNNSNGHYNFIVVQTYNFSEEKGRLDAITTLESTVKNNQ